MTLFVRSPQVKEKRVGSDLALYVESRRAIHVPDTTARFIWESLAQPVTFDELLFMLAESFDVDPGILERDLREALDLFTSHGLLVATTRDHGTTRA